MGSTASATAFWNTNIPTSQHTPTCPSFLTYAFKDLKDQAVLATPDADYQRQSWDEVTAIIRENRLDRFTRVPSDLRRYREYSAKLVQQHGSVLEFVMKERLRWEDLTARGKEMFEDADDYKILCNDWPYGVDPRIVHLVVWTKFELPSEPITPSQPLGDLTPEARRRIDGFVDETFVRGGRGNSTTTATTTTTTGISTGSEESGKNWGSDRVIWFKNWGALKSVHAVEHLHVMMFDPDPEFVRRITGGDVSLAERVARGEM